MSDRVCVDAQALLVVAGPVLQQPRAEPERAWVLCVGLAEGLDLEIQLKLLGHVVGGSGRFRKEAQVLECHAQRAGQMTEDKSVLAPLICLSGTLVAGPGSHNRAAGVRTRPGPGHRWYLGPPVEDLETTGQLPCHDS